MKIYIGLSIPKKFSLFASIIKWVERRPYDHAYVRLPEPMDHEYMIFQASNMQVNLYNVEIFKESHKSLREYEIEITDEQYKTLWRFAKSMLGIPYSLKGDWGVLLMKVFHLSKQPYDDGAKSEFCSELAATVCKMLDIPISQNTSAISPSDLDWILYNTELLRTENPIL